MVIDGQGCSSSLQYVNLISLDQEVCVVGGGGRENMNMNEIYQNGRCRLLLSNSGSTILSLLPYTIGNIKQFCYNVEGKTLGDKGH